MQFGVRSNPGPSVHDNCDGPGIVGVLPSKSQSPGPAFKTQSPEQGGGCRNLRTLRIIFRRQLWPAVPCVLVTSRWDRPLAFAILNSLLGGYAAVAIGADATFY